jgi:hypothetical protein
MKKITPNTILRQGKKKTNNKIINFTTWKKST